MGSGLLTHFQSTDEDVGRILERMGVPMNLDVAARVTTFEKLRLPVLALEKRFVSVFFLGMPALILSCWRRTCRPRPIPPHKLFQVGTTFSRRLTGLRTVLTRQGH